MTSYIEGLLVGGFTRQNTEDRELGEHRFPKRRKDPKWVTNEEGVCVCNRPESNPFSILIFIEKPDEAYL